MLPSKTTKSHSFTKHVLINRRQENHHTSHRKYDVDSGQVYHETEVLFQRKNATNWTRDYKTPRIVRKARSKEGPVRSLFDIAKSKCANELQEFDPDHFESVPWTIADMLWDEVVARHMESFHSWKLLASTYDSEAEFSQPEKRYFFALRQLPLPLRDYYNGLTSASNKWHVAVRLTPKQHAVSDLVAIASITNLAALDLSDGQLLLDPRPSVFDHRVMRSWAELAHSRRSFQHLRVLMFGWQDNLSEWVFEYLDNFPSLCYLIVTDCKDLHQKNRPTWEDIAGQKGWIAFHAKKSAKTLRTFLDDQKFQLGNISNLYYQSQTILNAAEGLSESTRRIRPLVECWIGTPRPWTHIIDEFPGTRTIWFERKTNCLQNLTSTAPKRVRERAKSPQTPKTTASPPPKRPQRKMIERRKDKRASDATALLAEMDFHGTVHR